MIKKTSIHPDDLLYCPTCGGDVEYDTVWRKVNSYRHEITYHCQICHGSIKPEDKPPQSASRDQK